MSNFLNFLSRSPSPFHAVHEIKQQLISAGFTELLESQKWNLCESKGYFFTRNSSAIVAFFTCSNLKNVNINTFDGFCIVGAHTDSPCLKVKPRSRKQKVGYDLVGVETYGGGLWNTWFDRDLSLAGRVFVHSGSQIEERLVDLEKPVMRVPTLAIHLDRSVNEGFKFNNENQLNPIIALSAEKALNDTSSECHHPALLAALASKLSTSVDNIGEFELCLYDTQKPSFGGLNDEFVFSARLDNLCMSYCAIQGLIKSVSTPPKDSVIRIVGLFDNEEVGSTTAHGANSNLMTNTLKRLTSSFDESNTAFEIALTKSYFVSADMAHAIHPNYSEKHEDNHRPMMNAGVVIKENANQRYATTSISTTMIREAAKMGNVKLQDFVVRNDSPCGSTIGPMISANLGIRTVDIGNPQLSMHSIREQCGSKDVDEASNLVKSLFENYREINNKMPK